jgi:hypothetical protein
MMILILVSCYEGLFSKAQLRAEEAGNPRSRSTVTINDGPVTS